jgi:hypothetical protein
MKSKNIQLTEKSRAEKYLFHFVADAAPRGAGVFLQVSIALMIPNFIFLSFIFLSLLLFKPT